MATPHSRAIKIITPSILLLLTGSAIFFWCWFEYYLNVEFDENGRYYDEINQVVYTDASFVYGVFAIICLVVGLFNIALRLRMRKNNVSVNLG